MKKKYVTILLGIAVSVLYLGGCAEIEDFLEVQVKESRTEESRTEESGTEENRTEESGTEESGTEESGTEESRTRESRTEEGGTQESRREEDGKKEVRYQKVSAVPDEGGKGIGSAVAMVEPEDLEDGPAVEYYPAVAEYAVDMETEGETYASKGTDENAVHILGEAQVVLRNAKMTRNSKTAGEEDYSACGMGAALLTTSGTAYLKNNTITVSADRGAGIFSYGDRSAVYAANTTVSTKSNASAGIRAARGGSFYGWNLEVETEGRAAPALRSDRRGGTLVVDGGTYTTRGADSPAVYSAGNTAVRSGTLTAEQWEAVCMEGNQSLYLYECDVSGNKEDDISNDCTWNVIIYQDRPNGTEMGHSTFEMNGGSLSAKNGGMFYTTNAESTITLSDVDIMYPMINEFFLKCTGNNNQRGWGERGANGARCLFTAVSQQMSGDVVWDSISELDFYMSGGSTLTGAVRKEENGASGEGHCNLLIEEGCTWTVTGDSTLSRLSCPGTMVDDEGNTVTVRGNDGTVYIQGAGKYTVAVEVYEPMANMSGASETTQWMEHQVEIPRELQ